MLDEASVRLLALQRGCNSVVIRERYGTVRVWVGDAEVPYVSALSDCGRMVEAIGLCLSAPRVHMLVDPVMLADLQADQWDVVSMTDLGKWGLSLALPELRHPKTI